MWFGRQLRNTGKRKGSIAAAGAFNLPPPDPPGTTGKSDVDHPPQTCHASGCAASHAA